MKTIIEILLLSMMLLLLGCESAGTVQTEDTGVAMLFDEAGQPVVNASVRVFKYRDSTGIYEDSISTNELGEYSFNQKLEAGRYTIWAETDTSVLYREDLIITPDSLFQDQDTLKPSRSIVVPVKVQPNHNPRTVEVQIWGTPIRHNVTADGFLNLNKIANGTYFTRLTTTLEGYTPTNDTFVIDDSSTDDSLSLPDTLKDTLELIYTGIPVVSGLTYSYDTLNTTVNLSWDQTNFPNIQAYVIERKLKTETVWPAAPLAHVYVSQASHPLAYSDVVSVGEVEATYQYRIKIIDNNSAFGVPFGVLEVNAPPASSASTSIAATSMQKAKAIVGNRGSINDVMSFTVNFSNPSRKLTKIDWFEGTTLLKTTPLTDLIISDSFEKSWPTIGAKNLTVKITDDAGFVWKKDIPVSIVEDKPVISFVDTTINLNVLDTLTAVVSDEFGEVVSYQWDWGNDGTIDATTPQFVKTQTEIEGGVPCKVTVIDDDGNVAEFVSGVTSQLVWEKVGDVPVDYYQSAYTRPHILNNHGIVVGGKNSQNQTTDLLIFDLNSYEWETVVTPLFGVVSMAYLDGVYYAIDDYRSAPNTKIRLWKSSNLTDWLIDTVMSGATQNIMMEPLGFMIFAFNGTLYSNMFSTSEGGPSDTLGVFWETTDGENWIKNPDISSPIHFYVWGPEWVYTENYLVFASGSPSKLNVYSFTENTSQIVEYDKEFGYCGMYKGAVILRNSDNRCKLYSLVDSRFIELNLNTPVDFDLLYNQIVEVDNASFAFTKEGVYKTK